MTRRRERPLRITSDSEVTCKDDTLYMDGDYCFKIKDPCERVARQYLLDWFIQQCKNNKAKNGKGMLTIGPYPIFKSELQVYFNSHFLNWTFYLDGEHFCINHGPGVMLGPTIIDRVKDMVEDMGGEVL